MYTEFTLDRNSKISKIKNGKTTEPSNLVSEMAKRIWRIRILMIRGSVNRIILEGISPVNWEHSAIVNCCKGKGDALDRKKL